MHRSSTLPRILLTAALAASLESAAIAQLNEPVVSISASDSFDKDRFGTSTAISGTMAIVGAVGTTAPYPWQRDQAHYFPGAAYVIDVSTGQHLRKLTASDGDARDQFGSSVAISGDLAIIGSPYDDDLGSGSGSAYLFDLTTGAQLFKLIASDGLESGEFGRAVAIGSGTAIVGARDAVYLFDVNTGSEVAKLTGQDIDAEQFGYSVALSGEFVLIGAPYETHDTSSGRMTGAAYLFNHSTGELITKLTGDSDGGNDVFGHSVAIGRKVALVGAPSDIGDQPGAAYLFEIPTGKQLAKLISPEPGFSDAYGNTLFDGFGYSVAVQNETVIAGAPWDDDVLSGATGAVYLIDSSTGQSLKLKASGQTPIAHFGATVAMGGTHLVIGGPDETQPGFAEIISLTPEPSSAMLIGLAGVLFGIVYRSQVRQ